MPQSGRRPQHHKRAFCDVSVTSALARKADIRERLGKVRFVPDGDITLGQRPPVHGNFHTLIIDRELVGRRFYDFSFICGSLSDANREPT
jgi:hypothetical protein